MKNKKTKKDTIQKCCILHLKALDKKDEQIMSLMLDNLNYKRKIKELKKANKCVILDSLRKFEYYISNIYKKYISKYI